MVAHDGQAALRLASENANPIHLLVTDVIMPHMSGPELAGRLKVLRPELRTLFITGYPGDTLLQKGGIPPSTRVVQKPFSVTQLAQSVRETLDG
jgi:two-component system cell cycle sensor histidine kinase/response regulator CckA